MLTQPFTPKLVQRDARALRPTDFVETVASCNGCVVKDLSTGSGRMLRGRCSRGYEGDGAGADRAVGASAGAGEGAGSDDVEVMRSPR